MANGLTIGHFLEALSGYRGDDKDEVAKTAVSSVIIDSRDATHGSVFVAFTGANVDGNQYVTDAFSKGSVLALVEKPSASFPTVLASDSLDTLPDPPFCLQVENTMVALQTVAQQWAASLNVRSIGITGSVGKTSTKELTHAVLAQRYRTLKTPKSFNNEIGLPLTLLQLTADHERAVLEMGTYGKGEIALLCELAKPTVGVVNNIGTVHMSRMGSQMAIMEAKRELVEALPATGTAILNLDDPLVMNMAEATQARIFTVGLTKCGGKPPYGSPDLYADNIQSLGLDGIACTLHYQGDAHDVAVSLIGRHSVQTVLRAVAIALVEGLTWSEIKQGLAQTQPPLRMKVVAGPNGSQIIDDTYNSNPQSAIAALNLLADLEGRRVAVLGDMLELGSAEVEMHEKVGRRAAEVADRLITVGKLGRLIGQSAILAGMAEKDVVMVDDAQSAVLPIKQLAQPNDFILIKGSLGVQLSTTVKEIINK